MSARLRLLLPVSVLLAACSAPDVGLVDGELRPCPNKPNCVNSRAAEGRHAIEPLRYSGDPAEAMSSLAAYLETLPRVEIIEASGRYLHATFTTKWMRWTDDIEFLIAPDEGVIHVRAAARVGYSDFGENEDRVEAIRAAWSGGK